MATARDFEGPAYQRIAAEWAELIDTGKLADGDRLPTRPELEDRYGVSRQVIRDALALLHQEGYLRSFAAKGTFVHRLPCLDLPMYVLEAQDRAGDSFVAAVEAQGHRAAQRITVETARPSDDIMAALGLSTTDLVTIRRRVRTVDDVPYAIADSYYPQELVAGTAIADPADIKTGARHVLADLGHEMVSHHDAITARRPHRREMRDLDIAPAVAVIEHARTSSTGDGTPVRYMLSILPSDRWRLTYQVSK